MADNVRLYYALVDDNDLPGLLSLFAEEVVYERPGYPPINGTDSLRRFYESERVIAAGLHTVHALLVDYPYAAVEGAFVGTLRDGGEATIRFSDFFEADGAGLFRFRRTYFFVGAI